MSKQNIYAELQRTIATGDVTRVKGFVDAHRDDPKIRTLLGKVNTTYGREVTDAKDLYDGIMSNLPFTRKGRYDLGKNICETNQMIIDGDVRRVLIKGCNVEISRPLEYPETKSELNRLRVVITTPDNRDFYADFVNAEYLSDARSACQETNEFAEGVYLPGKNKIFIKSLSEKNVMKTLEDLIGEEKFPSYFEDITAKRL
jgi:hypothetical protein